MQLSKWGGPLVLALALAACPSPERPQEAVTELPPAATPGTETVTPTPETVQVELREVGGSGIAGEATLRQIGAQTSVMLTLRGAPPNSTLQAHVHQGRCDQPGSVVAPLDPVITDAEGLGTSVTTVDREISALTDGQHLVQAHQPGGQPGAPVACGGLPART